ncbi:class I SAM-dependent methyltransferase [Methylophaga sp.]|uniref:class I SAM-dependent methyltransferase n=1 Tax=Methylophaga sp. TaxID=2024840 RepID=UPI0025E33DBB|nr:class I SAM-dependent methyltransferase [Methylophaga sp.]
MDEEQEIFDVLKNYYFRQEILDPQEDLASKNLIASILDIENTNSVIWQTLDYLKYSQVKSQKPFFYLSIYLSFKDLLYGHLIDPKLRPLHHQVFSLLHQQSVNWLPNYCNGYAYQGSHEIGITGVKPTEARMASYEIDAYLTSDKTVLDIGSNNGLIAVYLSRRCKDVDAIEYNPYLNLFGKVVAEYLGVSNIQFICADFYCYKPDKKYDLILSMANHSTIDGKLKVNFDEYMHKIFITLNQGGLFLFESHNIFGPGKGGTGDDGDLDYKLDIAAKYFEVIKYKMTQKFVPEEDVDKLMILFRRRKSIVPNALRTISKQEVIKKYN